MTQKTEDSHRQGGVPQQRERQKTEVSALTRRGRVQKRWVLEERRHADLIEHLLRVREIADAAQFLAPQFPEHLHDPFLMLGMDAAVERLCRALRDGEVIGIFADYDADGTPGAAVLVEGLRVLGGAVRCYIPTRPEGYGLSEVGLRALAGAGAHVVVTVDMGATARELVAFGRDLGLDIIVADHHTIIADRTPEAALAVLNPKQAACAYPEKELCGGVIAWKLLDGVLARLVRDRSGGLTAERAEAIRRWTLDLVGIATIADMVPLRGENRLLAHFGLRVLRKTRRLGLRALYRLADIDPARLGAGTVSFQIAPRLNAPTRLAAPPYQGAAAIGPQTSLALALLVTTDSTEAAALAATLAAYNTDRQTRLETMLAEAEAQVAAQDLSRQPILVVGGEGWAEGVVGLVAARLLQRYGRPAFAFSLTDEVAAGSARSIEAFPLVENLTAVKDLLTSFGGHHKAAGLKLPRPAFEAFRDAIGVRAAAQLTPADLLSGLRLDATLVTAELGLDLARRLEQFAPFGIGNPRPTFLLSDVRVRTSRVMGDGRHLALEVQPIDAGRSFRVVGFGQGEALNDFPVGSRRDLALQIDASVWNETPQLDLKLVDWRPVTPGGDR